MPVLLMGQGGSEVFPTGGSVLLNTGGRIFEAVDHCGNAQIASIELCETNALFAIGAIGWGGWCWYLVAFSESVCSSVHGWRLFCTWELMTLLEFSCKTPMADCNCLWKVIGLDVECLSAKSLICCCCRVFSHTLNNSRNVKWRRNRHSITVWWSGAAWKGWSISKRLHAFLICATSFFSFVKHAASLRESSVSTFSDCVS